MLQGSQCFTCTVGKKISKAQYFVDHFETVLPILQALPAAAVHYVTGTGGPNKQHRSTASDRGDVASIAASLHAAVTTSNHSRGTSGHPSPLLASHPSSDPLPSFEVRK